MYHAYSSIVNPILCRRTNLPLGDKCYPSHMAPWSHGPITGALLLHCMAARGWRLLLGLSVGAAIPRFFGGILRLRRIFGQQTKMSFPHYLPKKSKRGARLVVFSMFSCLFDVIWYHCHPTIFTRKHPAPKRRFLRRTLLTTAGPFLAQSEVEVPPKNNREWGDSWSVTHRND